MFTKGHGGYRRFKLESSPYYFSYDNIPEDPQHVFFDYSKFTEEKQSVEEKIAWKVAPKTLIGEVLMYQ